MSAENSKSIETSLVNSTTTDSNVWPMSMMESAGSRIDDLREITPSISPVFTEDQVRELTQQASDMELLLAHDTFKRINERMDALTPEQTSLLIATTASPFDHDVTYTDVLPNLSDPPSDPDHFPIVSSHGHDILFNEGLRLDLPVGMFPFGNITEVPAHHEEPTLDVDEHREPSSTSEEQKTETPKEQTETAESEKVSDEKETEGKETEKKEENETKDNEKPSPSGYSLRRSPRKQASKSEKTEFPEKRQLRTRGTAKVEEKEKPGAQRQAETKTELRRSPRAKGLQNLSEIEEGTSVKGQEKKVVQSEKQGKEGNDASDQGSHQSLRNKQKGVVPEDTKNVRRSPRIQHKPTETEQEKQKEKKAGRKKKDLEEHSKKDSGPEVVEEKKEKQKEIKEIKTKKDKVCLETETDNTKGLKEDEKEDEGERLQSEQDSEGSKWKKKTLAGKVQPMRTKARRSSRIAHAVQEQHKKEENITEKEKVESEDKKDTHSSHGIEIEFMARETSVAEMKDNKVVQKEPRKKQAAKQNVELNGMQSEEKKSKKQIETVKEKRKSVSPNKKEVKQKKVVQKRGSFGDTKSHERAKKGGEQTMEQTSDVEGIDERKKKDKDLSKKVQKERITEEKDKKEKVKTADESLKKTKQTDSHKVKDKEKNSRQVEILKGKETEVEKSEATILVGEAREEKMRRKSASQIKSIVKELTTCELSDEESESGDDDGEAEIGDDSDYDPDNDPERAWCICRKPHGNRFMICCDGCEEWFHGDCVGITMSQGRQMEKEGHEYICPKCKQKQALENTGHPQQKSEKQYKGISPRKRKLKMPISPEDQLKKKAKRLKKKRQSKDRERETGAKPERKEWEHTGWKARLESDKLIQEGLIAKPDEQVERKRRLSSSSSAESTGFKIPKKVRTTPTPAGYTTHMQRVCIRIGCKRSAEKGSVFCCDDCIARHAEHSLKLLAEQRKKHSGYKTHPHKPTTSPTSNVLSPWDTPGHPLQTSSEHKERVAVVEKTSGRVIAGMTAPTEADLVPWLQRHPTFEVLLPTVVKEEKKPEKKPDKKDEEHNIRENVRRALKDILSSRSKDAEDINVSTEEIAKYANSIEDEMYKYFGDTGHRYKNKYRSLIFNLKDTRNKVLVLQVLSGEATADRLVRMTPEQLASQELTKWREREAKHTLEMIKKDQEDMAHAKAHVVKKTHKGEVEVNEEDLSSLDSHAKEGSDLPDSSNSATGVLLIDTTEEHRIHLFDLNCRICTGRTTPPGEPPKRDPAVAIVSTTTTIQALAESSVPSPPPLDMSSPDSGSVSSALPPSPPPYSKPTKKVPAVWKGFVMMQNVAKFGTNAYCVSGPCDDLLQLLPDTIHVQGRIKHEQVWDYIFQLKSSSSRDVCVIRYEASSEEEKISCVSLYSYFQSRRRCGVVGNCYAGVKDMYLVPLAAHERVPRELLPFNGPGLDEPRPHMLLGIIVRVKAPVKRHRSHTQRSSSPPPKKRSSSSNVSESQPSTTQSPLRDSPVAEIDDIVFQYNTNQNKKPVVQTTYSPSATTPPSIHSTPSESSGTPSLSSGAVSSPVTAPATAKSTSSLVALEAQKLQLLELQEKAKQRMLEIQQQQGSAVQDSIASLSQFSLPATFAVPQLPLPQSKMSAPSLQEHVTQSSQNVTQSSQNVTQSTGVADEDAPYDPEEDLDLALEDAMAKENTETQVEQSKSVPIADSSTAHALPSSAAAFKDAFPRLQATLNALGIPGVQQDSGVSKPSPEQGEPMKKFSEPAPQVGPAEVSDSHVVKTPPEYSSTDREETQKVPRTVVSIDHHHLPPTISRQVSGMRQNPQEPEPFRGVGHRPELRHSQEPSTQVSVPAKDRGYHEPRFRDSHRPVENPGNRNNVRHPADHMGERSRVERAESRYPHDARPREPPWRDPRGPRDSRDPHDTRYTRDPRDSGWTRDRYRGRHEEGEYRDYPDRSRGRDEYDQGGYGRGGEQPRRRSWEESRYEGYRRERWRR